MTCKKTCLSFLALACSNLVWAHNAEEMEKVQNDESLSFAEKHMSHEHHIDSFDLESFFKIHDLDQNGVLTYEEVEAIYGLHHDNAKEDNGELHPDLTKQIMDIVMRKLDANKDGLVTLTEFTVRGKEGLPDFKNVAGLGHHYDSENEYFLHHEEIYHNTPETQQDEAYNHIEDIKHFANHDKIEKKEEDLLKKAMGKEHAQEIFDAPVEDTPRNEQEQGPKVDNAEASNEARRRGQWDGFRRPKDVVDRLRSNVPYKYKIRSSRFKEF